MRIEIKLTTTRPDGRAFVAWAPVAASIRLFDAPDTNPVNVRLQNAGSLGRVIFDTQRSDAGAPSLDLSLPADGREVTFWTCGEFGKPSIDYGDAKIDVIEKATSRKLGELPLMVRVRKDADDLRPSERDRFLAAFGTLNGQGLGRFQDFRNAHVFAVPNSPLREAHRDRGFLPWHRAYLLDLERELQLIDPTVALPYWRFDQPAPHVFTRAFMGEVLPNQPVAFTPGHPFSNWITDSVPGISRDYLALTATTAPAGVFGDAQTIALGGVAGAFSSFTQMEGNPHGQAHVSFSGFLSDPATAPRDPLFFLLHTNVDRLWARWQWLKKRHDPADTNSFPAQPARPIGHNLGDTMWPWNGSTTPPRPNVAPGGSLANSPETSAPGGSPTVGAMIDYLAIHGGREMAFAYDDVPYEL